MPHITTCSKCGKAYEESSEEQANAPGRLCTPCYRVGIHWVVANEDHSFFGDPGPGDDF